MNITQAKDILGDHFSFTADDTHNVIKSLSLPKFAKVLDVGTGIGNMAIMLALHGCEVITGEPDADNSVYAKQDWLGNARKVKVDQMIHFEPFDAARMHFKENQFDGIFFLGSLHHIDESRRNSVLQECVRTSTPAAPVCFFEPNEHLINIILQNDPSHPAAADPNDYIQGLGLASEKINGIFFNAFILTRQT